MQMLSMLWYKSTGRESVHLMLSLLLDIPILWVLEKPRCLASPPRATANTLCLGVEPGTLWASAYCLLAEVQPLASKNVLSTHWAPRQPSAAATTCYSMAARYQDCLDRLLHANQALATVRCAIVAWGDFVIFAMGDLLEQVQVRIDKSWKETTPNIHFQQLSTHSGIGGIKTNTCCVQASQNIYIPKRQPPQFKQVFLSANLSLKTRTTGGEGKNERDCGLTVGSSVVASAGWMVSPP